MVYATTKFIRTRKTQMASSALNRGVYFSLRLFELILLQAALPAAIRPGAIDPWRARNYDLARVVQF